MIATKSSLIYPRLNIHRHLVVKCSFEWNHTRGGGDIAEISSELAVKFLLISTLRNYMSGEPGDT